MGSSQTPYQGIADGLILRYNEKPRYVFPVAITHSTFPLYKITSPIACRYYLKATDLQLEYLNLFKLSIFWKVIFQFSYAILTI
jgi:hypothetical protein